MATCTGFYALGQLVPLRLWTTNASGDPQVPDAAPVACVLDEDGDCVDRFNMPALDQNVHDGWFSYRLGLDHRFATGAYTVLYTYLIDGTAYGRIERFEVIAGGDGLGTGVGLHFYRQPQADFLLLQTDTGVLKTRRNPRIRRT